MREEFTFTSSFSEVETQIPEFQNQNALAEHQGADRTWLHILCEISQEAAKTEFSSNKSVLRTSFIITGKCQPGVELCHVHGRRRKLKLSQNDLGSVIERLAREKPIKAAFYDDSELWRVWIVKANQNFVFITSKLRSLDVNLEDKFAEIFSIRAKKKRSTTIQYLGQWLGSGEGF